MSLRRFSLAPLVFFGLWLLWFCLPLTRDAARSGWRARFGAAPASFAPEPISPDDNSRDAQFVRALATGSGDAQTRALEQLGRKFPRDAEICAAQVVMSSDDLHIGRVRQPGPSSTSDPNWSVKLSEIETPSPAALRSWFAATTRGAQLEPKNSFWDWAKLIGLLAARRNPEIWPVLRAASQKTAFDDHASAGALANLRLQRARGVVPPISQIATSAAILFPHFAVMREAARQVSDDASGLRLSGEAANKKQALEGLRDFALLARTMRRESKWLIGSLVGQAIESIALYGGSYSPATPLPLLRLRNRSNAPLATYAAAPSSLIFFASQQKRPDIAAQLSRQWTELGTWRKKTRSVAGGTFLMGLDTRDVTLSQAGNWVGSLLLMGIPALFLLALSCFLLLRFVPLWRRENTVSPGIWSWGSGALLALAAVLALLSPIAWAVLGAWRTPGAGFVDILLSLSYDGNGGNSQLVPPSWQCYFPTVLATLGGLHLAVIWSARRQGLPSLGARLRRIFHAPDDDMAGVDLSPILALAATLAAYFALTVGVLAFLIAPLVMPNLKSLHDGAAILLAAFSFSIAFTLLSRLRTPAGRVFALALCRRFAWGELIFLTLLWGLLWIFATPAQSRFDAAMTRQLQIGEFQIARKQMGL